MGSKTSSRQKPYTIGTWDDNFQEVSIMTVYRALTIAGSDSGGGAGIQADLKTFQELEVYGMSAITAVTAQNTLGVQGVYPVPVSGIEQQIDSIAADLQPDAVKLGMLFNEDTIRSVVKKIEAYHWDKVIIDPVMVAKGGASLLQNDAVKTVREVLLPHAFIVTPNIPEAEVLSGIEIKNIDDRKRAAIRMHESGAKNVLIKGGHESGDIVIDLLFNGREFQEFASTRINTRHTHGTGCTFSAAITAQIARKQSITDAVKTAKNFIHAAISHELAIGSGHGPTNHWAYKRHGAVLS